MPRELQKSQCSWLERAKYVTVHFMQAYTFSGLDTSAMMSSAADLSFITTSVTKTKSKLYFHFSSGVPFKKKKNNNPFFFSSFSSS